jgi:ankyrin repeat protein
MKHFVKIICAVCLSVTQTITGQQTGEIHKAVFAGDMNKIREIIDADTTLLESKDEDGKTPLNIACFMIRNGFAREPEIAKFLISRGANVNSSSNDGFTPLYGACTGSGPDFDLVKQLIAKGANVNAKNNDGSTALFETATSRNLEVTRFLNEQQCIGSGYLNFNRRDGKVDYRKWC